MRISAWNFKCQDSTRLYAQIQETKDNAVLVIKQFDPVFNISPIEHKKFDNYFQAERYLFTECYEIYKITKRTPCYVVSLE